MKRILFLLTFILTAFFAQAQYPIPTDEELEKGEDDQKIEAAEYFFEQKLYYQSLRIWNSLLKDYPDNPRINYMAGKCRFLSSTQKAKSLVNFNYTLGHISNKTKLDTKHITEAPLDALFYLGKASHLNQKFDDALKYYDEYLSRGGSKLDEKEKTEVERWRKWTNNAKLQVANPNQNIKITNLGPEINTTEEEYSPVLSLDENVIYFTSRRLRSDKSNENVIMPETGTLFEDVYLSFKEENGKWSSPKMMNFGNEADQNEATVSVSADGTEVYIYFDKEGGGDLYKSSFLEGGFNAELEHLTGDINSKSWETHCTLMPDGKTIFFTTNRPGGYGGLDIYRMIKLPNGEWSKAEILPPPINTPFDEDAPFIHPSGNVLYFSSNGPNSMGGCDVFYSRIIEREPLKFSEPVNMGYPLNTVDDDVFFVMDAEGKTGYYSSDQNGGYGAHDILMVEFIKPMEEPFAILKGLVKMVDGSQIPDNITVNITDVTANGELFTYKPRPLDGGYVMALKPCNEYTLEYYKGEESLKKEKFKVPCSSSYQEIRKELLIDTLYLAIDKPMDKTKPDDKVINTSPLVNEKISLPPLYYEKYFDYNILDVTTAEQKFNAFIADVKKRVESGGKVNIKIEASASKVPTTTFKTNQKLAQSRWEESKQEILGALKAAGVDVSKLKFEAVKAIVQGPAYRNDYLENKNAYGKFQYTKIWVD